MISNFFRKFFNKKFVCKGPFSQVFIYPDGRVMLCEDCMVGYSAFVGNLNENTFDEIYNGEKAIKFRQEILDGIYKYCNLGSCLNKCHFNFRFIPEKVSFKTKQTKYPELVCIGADEECNCNCIICRPDIIRLKEEELSEYREKIEKIYLPIMKDAKQVTLTPTGDPFGSRNTRELIKAIIKKYPHIKFNLMTNGILCDKYNLDELGLTGRINHVMVSLHASNEEIYNRVVKNGNFNKVKENLSYLKSLKDNRKIKSVALAFVVNVENFENIPDFIEFAKSYGFEALFWPCSEWERNSNITEEPLNVCNPKHPKFKSLCSILIKLDLNQKDINFSPAFHLLKKRISEYIKQQKI